MTRWERSVDHASTVAGTILALVVLAIILFGVLTNQGQPKDSGPDARPTPRMVCGPGGAGAGVDCVEQP